MQVNTIKFRYRVVFITVITLLLVIWTGVVIRTFGEEPQRYTVTVAKPVQAMLEFAADEDGYIGKYKEGDYVYLTAQAAQDYMIEAIEVQGTQVNYDDVSGRYYFEMPSNDVVVNVAVSLMFNEDLKIIIYGAADVTYGYQANSEHRIKIVNSSDVITYSGIDIALTGYEYGLLSDEEYTGTVAPGEEWSGLYVLPTGKVPGRYDDSITVSMGGTSKTIEITQTVSKAVLRVVLPNQNVYTGDAVPVIYVRDFYFDGFVGDDDETTLENIVDVTYDISDTQEAAERILPHYPEVEDDRYILVFEGGYLTINQSRNQDEVRRDATSDATSDATGDATSDATQEETTESTTQEVSSDSTEETTEESTAETSTEEISSESEEGTSEADVPEESGEENETEEVTQEQTSQEMSTESETQSGSMDKQTGAFVNVNAVYSVDTPVIVNEYKLYSGSIDISFEVNESIEIADVYYSISEELDTLNDVELDGHTGHFVLNDSFKNDIYICCVDTEFNVYTYKIPKVWLDAKAPEVEFVSVETDEEVLMVPTMIKVRVSDERAFDSGIDTVYYTVDNGEKVYADVADGEIAVKVYDTGSHYLEITAIDTAGNKTIKTKMVEVADNPVISVVVPTSFMMTIDPYELNDRGTIYSEEWQMINKSSVDIDVAITETELTINRDGYNISQKNCRMYINYKMAEDVRKIELPEGVTNHLMEFQMKASVYDENGEYVESGENSIATFSVDGSISEGSETYWKSGDISIFMAYSFRVRH